MMFEKEKEFRNKFPKREKILEEGGFKGIILKKGGLKGRKSFEKEGGFEKGGGFEREFLKEREV